MNRNQPPRPAGSATDDSRWPQRADLVDMALAIGVAVALVVNLAVDGVVDADDDPIRASTYLLSVLACLPLAARRRMPVTVLFATSGVVFVYVATEQPLSPIIVCVSIAGYSVAAHRDRRTLLMAMSLLPIAIGIGSLFNDQDEPTWSTRLGVVSLLAIPIIIGDAVRSRRVALAEVNERLRIVEASRELEARRAVEAERLRIARDLHDVVAHSIATINVQAGVAAHVIDDDRDAARGALVEIKEASRGALAELRATLRVLRDDDDLHPDEPLPDLTDLPTLVEQSGTSAVVDTVGTPAGEIDPAVGIAGYRIVQEALTNVLKHAPGAAVSVRVEYAPDVIRLSVVDDGSTDRSPAASDDGAGLGLVGIVERASSIGGTATARHRLDRGFEVTASLPYAPTAAGDPEGMATTP